jgi:hypothetical protein
MIIDAAVGCILSPANSGMPAEIRIHQNLFLFKPVFDERDIPSIGGRLQNGFMQSLLPSENVHTSTRESFHAQQVDNRPVS